jgi:hypothetical protein
MSQLFNVIFRAQNLKLRVADESRGSCETDILEESKVFFNGKYNCYNFSKVAFWVRILVILSGIILKMTV